ncbi:MAG: hypothetical protein QM541_12395 [Flavobacterium sp.]|nr:hypothetical protein [Flavobacterium sp.]
MKQLIFSLAFMLIGSVAFANHSQLKEVNYVSKTEKVTTNKVIDFNTFLSSFNYKSIDKTSITFDVMRNSFIHTDSCGNSWTVEYCGFSFFEVCLIL